MNPKFLRLLKSCEEGPEHIRAERVMQVRDLLSGLRGPDDGNDKLKEQFSVYIRLFVFGREYHTCGFHPLLSVTEHEAYMATTPERLREIRGEVDGMYGSAHFRQHIRHALTVILDELARYGETRLVDPRVEKEV